MPGPEPQIPAERRLLEQIAMRVIDVPGLFTIMPSDRTSLDPRNLWSKPIKITLWCTHPGECHPVPEASYETPQPKEWFVRALPYLQTTLRLLKLAPIVRGVLAGYDIKEVASHLEVLEAVCKVVEDEIKTDGIISSDGENDLTHWTTQRVKSPLDREIERLLRKLGESTSFRPLHQVITTDGDVAWVCPAHYKKYYSPSSPKNRGSIASSKVANSPLPSPNEDHLRVN